MSVAQAQTPAKVLHVVPSADVAELDPTRAANQIGRIYSQMVFDTLFALDHTLSPKPMMVEKEVVSADGLTYSFTIRPGLKFTDGSAVTHARRDRLDRALRERRLRWARSSRRGRRR